MKNKTGIIALTVTLALVCIYYLSFSFVTNYYRSKAESFATNKEGKVAFEPDCSHWTYYHDGPGGLIGFWG